MTLTHCGTFIRTGVRSVGHDLDSVHMTINYIDIDSLLAAGIRCTWLPSDELN